MRDVLATRWNILNNNTYNKFCKAHPFAKPKPYLDYTNLANRIFNENRNTHTGFPSYFLYPKEIAHSQDSQNLQNT